MTQLLPSRTPEQRAEAVAGATALLRRGDAVALPTETVYGLAADALNAEAVARIFEAKERPRFDPLIVHLPDHSWLERVARIENDSSALIERLIAQFWPGPLTIVLPRREIVPDIVTAGLDTVAVRISAHPMFAEIIRTFDSPLAAPSANRFGRVSPTTAQHVLDELAGRIPLVVDAGPTEHGIESTIIAPRNGRTEVRQLSERQNLREAAANLFRYLRELDNLGLDLIVAEKLPEDGLGAAINDRLRRASRSGALT